MYLFFFLLFLFFSYKYILIVLNKYKIENIDVNKLPSKIIVIGSHTSIYDFFIGLFIYYSIFRKRYSTYVFMKNTFEQMCRPLLQSFDKKFKIISVNSSSRNTSHKSEGLTEQICNQLKDKDNYIIFISPEGTRKCTNKLRTGYWYIAKNLNINIIYLGIDYQSKEINMEKCRKPFETWEEEEDYFIKTCVKYTPLYPERCYWTKNYYE